MNAAPVYDLILQGGHVICPASGIDGVMDVAIAGGKTEESREPGLDVFRKQPDGSWKIARYIAYEAP